MPGTAEPQVGGLPLDSTLDLVVAAHVLGHGTTDHQRVGVLDEAGVVHTLDVSLELVVRVLAGRAGGEIARVADAVVGHVAVVEVVLAQVQLEQCGGPEGLRPLEPVHHRTGVLLRETVGIEPEQPRRVVGSARVDPFRDHLVADLDAASRPTGDLAHPRPLARVAEGHPLAIPGGSEHLVLEIRSVGGLEASLADQVVVEEVMPPAEQEHGVREPGRTAHRELVVLGSGRLEWLFHERAIPPEQGRLAGAPSARGEEASRQEFTRPSKVLGSAP